MAVRVVADVARAECRNSHADDGDLGARSDCADRGIGARHKIAASTITVTQADMQLAVAYWLNATTLKEPVRVIKVEVESKTYGAEHFNVTFERAEPPRSEATP